MLKTIGRLPEGIAAYRKAITLNPLLGDAWWGLANLKTVKFNDADIEAMDAALESPRLSDQDRLHIHFALGKALHDAGRADDAFAHYSTGNTLRLKTHQYRAQTLTKIVDRCIEKFTAQAFADHPGGCEAPDPIFIVGLPRSGSTLLEQILSSHSLVEGTTELQDVPVLARKVGDYPKGMLDLDAATRRELGEEYLKRASVQRRTDRPFFIDKMPNNWLYVPFIQLILPKAKIIDARRHPLGCCFSNFRQHFAHGQDFTYDLAGLAAFIPTMFD